MIQRRNEADPGHETRAIAKYELKGTRSRMNDDGLRYRLFSAGPVHVPRGIPVEIERSA
jgi:hypothetical protein